MTTINFTKVNLPYGWLGNMSPHPVIYEGIEYKTTEALFQCLRFKDYPKVQEEIRAQKSPLYAKKVAKFHQRQLRNKLLTSKNEDIENMATCLELKLQFHPNLKQLLIDTKDAVIIEDCTSRPNGSGIFWGAAFVKGQWEGENVLGKLWMNLRDDLRSGEYELPTLSLKPSKVSSAVLEEWEF